MIFQKVIKYVEGAIHASTNLQNLINDLLDMAKIKAAVFRLSFHEFNLIQAIAKVFQILEYQAEFKKIKFYLQIDSRNPQSLRRVIGDERRISQILINFISNSLKFTN
jgi:two-component system sensor histidine kinase/response regulator